MSATDWAGHDGSSLNQQEDGCGALTGWQWDTGCTAGTQHAWFNLPFLIAAGCVERAIKSAGGPGGLSCIGEGSTLLGVDGETYCTPQNDSKVLAVNKELASSGSSASVTTTHVLALPKPTSTGT